MDIEPFKGKFCTMKFQYSGLFREKQHLLARSQEAENIPRGGAYWMEDIVQKLDWVRVKFR